MTRRLSNMYLIVGVVLVALLVLFCMGWAVRTNPSVIDQTVKSSSSDKIKKPTPLASVWLAGRDGAVKFAEAIDQGQGIALVSFESSRETVSLEPTNAQTPAQPGPPKTGYVGLYIERVPTFRIDGVFSLTHRLNGSIPKLGVVAETLRDPLANPQRAFRRLRALEQNRQKAGPLLYLATWPLHSTGVSDATFVGPLAEYDLAHYVELGGFCREIGYDALTKTDAISQLNSDNPLLVWLALSKLQDLRVLTVDFFSQASLAVPVEHLRQLVLEYYFGPAHRDPRFRSAAAIGFLSGVQSPERQAALLKILIDAYPNNLLGSRDSIPLPSIQEGARQFRREFANDPSRQEVCRLLDQLLSIQ